MRVPATQSATAIGLITACLLAGCAGKKMVMEVSGTILYERPKITEVSHTVADARAGGGAAALEVVMRGDPGLAATFDIQPGIVERHPMKEMGEGRYVGTFQFPADAAGGPYTIIVRLRHEAAGEVTWRDPALVTIPLAEGAEEP